MDVTPERDAVRRISACYCAPSRSHPVNGARRRAEEGPLWGSDPGDVQRIGSDAPMIGSTVASPQAGPLLHVAPILLHVPARLSPIGGGEGVFPFTLHPSPFTLHPSPFTLHPSPFTLHPSPFTLHLECRQASANANR